MAVVRLHAAVTARRGSLVLEAELRVEREPLILVGPNGSGKTTLLETLLGVVPEHSGRIELSGEVLLDDARRVCVPVEKRRIAYVPQDHALFPHMDVRGNLAFALSCAGAGSGTRERTEAALDEFGVSALATRLPPSLSGGERQRVALARALCVRPRAILLDEPLASLDVGARHRVRAQLAQVLQILSIPAIVVTHEPADARAIAGSIAVLEAGRVTQSGTWADLVRAPATPFVSEFVSG